jgi:isocitrate dehydrogenase
MFEAIHGSAPRRAGLNMANPSALLLGAVMMLVHIDQPDVASRVHNAWLRTIEDGIHTYDVYSEGTSKLKVGTREFADAVIARVGELPRTFTSADYSHRSRPAEVSAMRQTARTAVKDLVGVDVFLDWNAGSPDELGATLQQVNDGSLRLEMISNRGVKVWPGGVPETFCSRHWRCRFLSVTEGGSIAHGQIVSLLQRVADAGFDFIKTENLCTFDGERGYSLDQGQ